MPVNTSNTKLKPKIERLPESPSESILTGTSTILSEYDDEIEELDHIIKEMQLLTIWNYSCTSRNLLTSSTSLLMWLALEIERERLLKERRKIHFKRQQEQKQEQYIMPIYDNLKNQKVSKEIKDERFRLWLNDIRSHQDSFQKQHTIEEGERWRSRCKEIQEQLKVKPRKVKERVKGKDNKKGKEGESGESGDGDLIKKNKAQVYPSQKPTIEPIEQERRFKRKYTLDNNDSEPKNKSVEPHHNDLGENRSKRTKYDLRN